MPIQGPPTGQGRAQPRPATRRAPRYRSFVAVGVVVGILLGLTVAWLLGARGDDSTSAVVLMALAGGLVGGWAGALVAVLIDRRSA